MTPDQFFDPKFNLAKLEPFAELPARKNNIWLASYPKSGNTWMRLFLASYMSGKSQADINDDLADNHQCNSPKLAALYAKKPVKEFSNLDNARARVGIHRLYAREPRKLFIKTHCAVAGFMGHPMIDPASTFASIVVMRNPLAVLPSYARHMGLSIDQAVMGMNNPKTALGNLKEGVPVAPLSSWSSFTRSWIAAERELNCVYVKYEDMKENPLEAFSKVLAHVRVPVDEERVMTAVGATDFEKLKAQDLKDGFKERTKADKGNVFFRSGKVDGWRKELNEEQIRATIRNHWDVMEQLNYVPEDYAEFFEDHKFKVLETYAKSGVSLGIYAKDLNELRAKRGIKAKLAVKAAKTAVSRKEARRARAKARPQAKRTFG